MRVGLRRLARPRSLFATATIMSSVVVLTNTEPETNVTPDTNSANEEEPQNALTQKFTDKEWVALKEFRVRRSVHHPTLYSLTAARSLSHTSRMSLRRHMMVRKAHGRRLL
jgi:hypothetical protein